MKKHISILLLLCLMYILPAQKVLEDNDIAQNWTLTDINGQSYTLYDYLNQDKVVVLYFFDASVSPCWTYHQTNALQDLQTQYGAGAKDSVQVFYIEANLATSVNNIHGNLDNGQGAWMVTGDYVTNNPVPIINLEATNNQIFTDYRLSDYPLVITICPERVIKISGLRTTAQHVALYSDPDICQRQCNCAKDLAIVKYFGPNYSCSDHMFHPRIMVQNLGQDTITHFQVKYNYCGPPCAINVPIYIMADSEIFITLAPFDTALITFDTYFLHDAGYMTAQAILYPGSADTPRSSNNTLYFSTIFPLVLPETDTMVVFKLNTDQYGEEIIWNLQGSNNDIIMSGGPYPNLPDTGVTEHIIPLQLEKGECYKITIFDTFGDGICCDNGHGSYQLLDSDGTVLIEGGTSFLEAKVQFRAHDPNFVTSVAPISKEKVAVYPMPAQNDLIIQLEQPPKHFVAKIIDINGKQVKTWESDKAKQFIDVSTLNSGIYLLHLVFDGINYTQKIAIVH